MLFGRTRMDSTAHQMVIFTLVQLLPVSLCLLQPDEGYEVWLAG